MRNHDVFFFNPISQFQFTWFISLKTWHPSGCIVVVVVVVFTASGRTAWKPSLHRILKTKEIYLFLMASILNSFSLIYKIFCDNIDQSVTVDNLLLTVYRPEKRTFKLYSF